MDQTEEMDAVYRQFQLYDFEASPTYKPTLEQVYNQYLIVLSDKDLEVKADLHNGVLNYDRIPEEDREQLQLQTKIFVFCSETDNILEIQDYEYWLAINDPSTLTQKEEPKIQEIEASETGIARQIDDVVDTLEPAEYTSNYQEVVDMIVNNKPISGIKQIPDTVIDPANASASTLSQRKKPWETDDSAVDPVVEAAPEASV